MANTLALLRSRLVFVVLALVVLSALASQFGVPPVGMWEGPL